MLWTHQALDAPTDTSKTELDKAMADIKEQLALLSKPTKPVRQNDALRVSSSMPFDSLKTSPKRWPVIYIYICWGGQV